MTRMYEDSEVQAMIEAQIPTLKNCEVQFIGNGCDSDAYLVNGTFIFKFPRHPYAAKQMKREIEFLKQIQGKVPISVPVVVFEGDFWAYESLPGEPLTRELLFSLPEKTQDDIAKQLAHFLKVLHSLPVSGEGLELDKVGEYEYEQREILSLVTNKEPIKKLYDELFQTREFFNFKPTFIHRDLSHDHIFFCKETNKIVGIIDFGDAGIGDKDEDFLYLFEEEEEYGEAFALKVLAYYGHENVELVREKFKFKEKYWCIPQLLLGKEHGNEAWCLEAEEKIRLLK